MINEDLSIIRSLTYLNDDRIDRITSILEHSISFYYPETKPGIPKGEISDGYHTFNELYRYRMLYNAAFFNALAKEGSIKMCKSRRHSDGEKCFGSDDWFIVMAILPTGQISNHYESKYWDLFNIPESEIAFEYDGHTPNEAADRIERYLIGNQIGIGFKEAMELIKYGHCVKRHGWRNKYIDAFTKNYYCGNLTTNHIGGSLILVVDEKTNELTSWSPSMEDILSNDWETYKPEIKK